MNPDFARQLSYTSTDFNDFETDGIELGRGPLSSFQVKSPESMEEDVGGRMKKKPKLVGGKVCARSAVRQQMVLVLLEHKFHCPPAGIDRLINEPAVPVLQVGDDETGVRSGTIVFDLGDDSSCLRPGFDFIESFCEHSNRLFFLIEPQGRLFDKGLDLSDQRRERLKPQNIFHVVVFTKIKDCRTGVVGICPQKDAPSGQACLILLTTRLRMETICFPVGRFPGRSTVVINLPLRPS